MSDGRESGQEQEGRQASPLRAFLFPFAGIPQEDLAKGLRAAGRDAQRRLAEDLASLQGLVRTIDPVSLLA